MRSILVQHNGHNFRLLAHRVIAVRESTGEKGTGAIITLGCGEHDYIQVDNTEAEVLELLDNCWSDGDVIANAIAESTVAIVVVLEAIRQAIEDSFPGGPIIP